MSRAGSIDGRQSMSREANGHVERNPSQDLATTGEDKGVPEDDGMRDLRQQLHEIRLLAVSTEEKARRMHELMTKDYDTHVSSEAPSLKTRPSYKASQVKIASDSANPYDLLPSDLEPTFSPIPNTPIDEEALETGSSSEDDGPLLGCMHYKRNVKIQCFDCRRWFPCRHCHDNAPDLPYHHNLNRKKTQNMLCMLCMTPQPASEACLNCGEYAAYYYCSKCKLWDNDINKSIYHCDDCGLCRIGRGLGKDFVHCKRCNVCISIGASAAHPCIERATDSDCPLCLAYLFESQTPVVSLPCGHYMHGECFKDLMAVTYKCPVCNKSAVNMEIQWRKLDDEIEAQPMPEDDNDLRNLLPHIEGASPMTEDATEPTHTHRPRKVYIGCNDCGARCSTPFHWLGLKCQVCGGYNTNQMAPLAGHESDAERVLRQQAQHRQHDFTGHSVMRDNGIGIESDSQEDEEEASEGSRVDSGYAIPSSPPQAPSLGPRRASVAHSPSRRYFLQAEEARRSSFTSPFTAPRFTAPSMPNLPNLPHLPRMSDLPRLPDMPALPQMPNLPHLPAMSNIELGRFSPYDMVAALSRSLSPMRISRDGAEHSTQQSTPSTADYRQLLRRPRWRNSAPPGTLDDLAAQATGRDEGDGPFSGPRPELYRTTSIDEHVTSSRGVDPNDDEDIFADLIGHR